jgi:hypothetical protein
VGVERGTPLVALAGGEGDGAAPGDQVGLVFRRDRLHLFETGGRRLG